jgi:CRP-like cAMP-binding protein
MLEAFRLTLPQAPVFAFLEKFDAHIQKKKRILTKGETLFDPGENPYFYIVASGGLGIFRINASGEKKEIGRTYAGAFVGEGILSDRYIKEVQAVSLTESTSVFALEKEDIEYYETIDTATMMHLYKHINNVTSLRLQDSGKELAIMYESAQKIQEFREHGKQGLMDSIVFLRNIFGFESCILIENHPYVPGLCIYRYNTKSPLIGLIQSKVESDKIFEAGEISGDLLSMRSDQPKFCTPLMLGEQILGYLICAKHTDAHFTDSERRTLEHVGPMIA